MGLEQCGQALGKMSGGLVAAVRWTQPPWEAAAWPTEGLHLCGDLWGGRVVLMGSETKADRIRARLKA